MSVFVVAQSSLEIPEGLMNNPVYMTEWHSSYMGPDYENKDGS